MLIHLYGPDSYRLQQRLKSILEEFKKKHSGLGHDHFDLEIKEDFERLNNFVKSQSLFDLNKLGVVAHVEALSEESKKILKSVSESQAITLIVVSEQKLPAVFAFLYKKPVLSEKFEALENHELYGFIKKEAVERGVSLTPAMLQSLIQTFGSDTWSMVTELEKIALGGVLEAKTILPQFFTLIQKIKSGDQIGPRLVSLAYLMESEDSAKIFNILAAIADTKLKKRMADYDVAVKSGKLEYDEALTDLVLEN